MKKLSLAFTLATALMLTVTAGMAMAAPGDYPPGTQTTSDKYTQTLDSTQGQTDTTQWGLSNGLVNANQSGKNADQTPDPADPTKYLGDVIKNVKGQRIHGEYANDTNSCASCHQTHTASGKALLIKNGVYNTCTACHDGTLGFYNVFTPSNAGSFGGNPDKTIGNASVHLATGAMTVASAPGGNRASTDAQSWGKTFDCSSCHAPHGSYSDRLLSYNPNNVSTTPPTDAGGNPTGGRLIVAGTANVAANGTDTGGNTRYSATKEGTVIAGPYLYGYAYGKPKIYWSQIRIKDVNGVFQYTYPGDPTKSWNDVLDVNYRGGYFTDPNNVLFGIDPVTDIQWDVAPAVVVKMNQTDIAPQAARDLGLPVMAVTGYQSGVSSFCAACHTDYNSNNAQTVTGTFSTAFRHKIVQSLKSGMIGEPSTDGTNTPNSTMVCLSCHYAHGTDVTVMKDGRDLPVTVPDVNPSSALKRYVNMGVCWKCHTDSKAEELVNNNSYGDQVDAGTAPVQ